MLRRHLIQATALAALFTSAAAAAPVMNPPPASAFSGYKSYELRPLQVPEDLQSSETGRKAAAKIQEHLQAILAPVLALWSQSASAAGNDQTLVFEPRILTLRFIGGAKRFWAGALAGDSRVLLGVRIVEQPSGRVLGEPQFYQQGAAMAGAWSFGAHDNTMLSRVVDLATSYSKANYDSAVGGPTGQ